MIEELRKAGNIARHVHSYARKIIGPGVSILEVANNIEQKILDLGGEPAFPVNISINNITAHYTPSYDDNTIIKDGDVVKIDFGVHVDGYIVDTAFSVEINDNKYKDLILSAKEALLNAKNILRKNIEVWMIGDIIERTIKKYGYVPIKNLFGHNIERYNLHGGIFIPNYNNSSRTTLSDGVYAVEPFSSTKDMYVKDGKGSTIYILKEDKNIRDPKVRKFLEFIKEKYKGLPFCYRWLYNDFKDKVMLDTAINLLKREGIIYEFPILITSNDNVVTQFESTFYINGGVHDLIDFYD